MMTRKAAPPKPFQFVSFAARISFALDHDPKEINGHDQRAGLETRSSVNEKTPELVLWFLSGTFLSPLSSFLLPWSFHRCCFSLFAWPLEAFISHLCIDISTCIYPRCMRHTPPLLSFLCLAVTSVFDYPDLNSAPPRRTTDSTLFYLYAHACTLDCRAS
ncbi:hypothetical protein EV126DRAFT_87327 [Verticillium dahliae]|nr:hypothetical protein EV126DRAFT_87327 [Verticillium dahliae]